MAINPAYKVDKNIRTIEILWGPDGLGRYYFFSYWWQENFHLGPQWRGQIFVANTRRTILNALARGFTVRVVDEQGRVWLHEHTSHHGQKPFDGVREPS
jgi:hypothetical protein